MHAFIYTQIHAFIRCCLCKYTFTYIYTYTHTAIHQLLLTLQAPHRVIHADTLWRCYHNKPDTSTLQNKHKQNAENPTKSCRIARKMAPCHAVCLYLPSQASSSLFRLFGNFSHQIVATDRPHIPRWLQGNLDTPGSVLSRDRREGRKALVKLCGFVLYEVRNI